MATQRKNHTCEVSHRRSLRPRAVVCRRSYCLPWVRLNGDAGENGGRCGCWLPVCTRVLAGPTDLETKGPLAKILLQRPPTVSLLLNVPELLLRHCRAEGFSVFLSPCIWQKRRMQSESWSEAFFLLRAKSPVL